MRSGQMLPKASISISIPLVTMMALIMINATAQEKRPSTPAPVLHYDAPPNFMRSAVYPPDDYVSTQFNASIQVYPFEPFTGNVAEMFQRTLLRDRIDAQHREENVASMPQFERLDIPGAEAAFSAIFSENIVGLLRPHMRIVIVARQAAAIVDASAINASLWPRLLPELNGLIQTMRVDTASAPPSLADGPGRTGLTIAGLYRGTKPKFMTGLTFQPSYFVPALHFYLFSPTGRVYRAYDQIRAPSGDITRFDFDAAQQSDPANSGRYTIKDGKLYIKMGNEPMISTTAPDGNAVIIQSVTYVHQ
jgi:hypothetical protein